MHWLLAHWTKWNFLQMPPRLHVNNAIWSTGSMFDRLGPEHWYHSLHRWYWVCGRQQDWWVPMHRNAGEEALDLSGIYTCLQSWLVTNILAFDCKVNLKRILRALYNTTLQVDTYGLCGVVHCLLHGSYMEIEKRSVVAASQPIYRPKAPFKR